MRGYEDLYEIRQMIKGTQCFLLQWASFDQKILDKNLLEQNQYSSDEFNQLKQKLETEKLLNVKLNEK